MTAIFLPRCFLALLACIATAAGAQPLTGVAQVGAGGDFSCALTNSGAVKCWGQGYGPVPADVPGLASGVQAITVGGSHACALTAAGGVKCWHPPGGGQSGNLGDGTYNISTTPVDVVGLSSGVTAIDAGAGHTCAVLASGGLKCWGINVWGQIGGGTSAPVPTPQTTPVDVVGLTSGVTAVAAGGSHTCAIVGGGVKCWGYAGQGQMGNGPPANLGEPTPVDVAGLSGVVAISAGGFHSCGVMTSGGVKCWGDAYGNPPGSNVPVDIQGIAPDAVVSLSAGGSHTCVATQTVLIGVPIAGLTQCWGTNRFGQLGDLTQFDRELPVGVYGVGATQVSAGSNHTCAVYGTGEAKCWGRADTGAVGNGATGPSPGAVWTYPATVGNLTQQTVTFAGGFPPRQVSDPPFAVTGSSSSGLPVQFASSTPSTCYVVSGSSVAPIAMGICTVVALQSGDSTYAAAPAVSHSFVLQGSSIPRLANLSTRMGFQVAANNDLIAGFVIGGSAPKTVVVRAIGPSLAAYGVSDPNPNPYLMLSRSDGRREDNDDWQVVDTVLMQPIPNPDATRIQEIGFAPGNALEATMIRTLKPGAYTAMIPTRLAGTAILELYELDRPESPLINISSRGQVRAGDGRLIAGFIIQGNAPKTVAIVATGPSLVAHNVPGPLADPTITLVRSSDQAVIATNDNWGTAPNAAEIQQKGFAPPSALESAILVTLPPGAYTAILGGANGSTGAGVIGVYEVQ